MRFRSRRFTRRSRFVRRRRFTPRRLRSNRIYRRFVRRTAIRPELKWADVNLSTGNIAAGATQAFGVTPGTMVQGAANGNRIGNQVKFTKVHLRFIMENNSNTVAPLTAPTKSTGLHRVIVWSPRGDFADCSAVMATYQTATQIDFNLFTVYRDFTVQLSPPYMSEAVGNDIAAGPSPNSKLILMTIKYPRKVKFGTNNDVDSEKFGLFITFIARSLNLIVNGNMRTYYLDA